MNPNNSIDESFLDQPFAQASLRDHLRLAERLRSRSDPSEGALRSFFALCDQQIACQTSAHRLYDLPQFTFAIEQHLREWTVVRQAGELGADRRPWIPVCMPVEVAPGVFRSVVRWGTWFLQQPDGRRRVFDLDTISDGCTNSNQFSMYYPKSEESAAREEFCRLREWIDEHHYLKGQTIQVDGRLIAKSAGLTWDDAALDDRVRRTLLENLRQFMSCREAFRRNGVPNRRGLLLFGPPGNGKTLIGRILSATESATMIYVTAADADDLDSLRKAFAAARRLKPTIVFLEDIDLYATDRRSSSDGRVLGEILAQLDGLENNDGLMIIATTNDLESIEPAIRERPNRFDVVLEIGPPDETARRKILSTRLAKVSGLSDNLLDEAVERTAGFSGAQVQEAAWRIIQHAILHGSLTPDGIAQPTLADLEAALPGIGSSKREIGFSRGEADRGHGGRRAATNGRSCIV